MPTLLHSGVLQAVEDLLARATVDGQRSGGSRCAAEVGSGSAAGQRRVSFAEFRAFFLLLPRRQMLVDYWLSVRWQALLNRLVTYAHSWPAAPRDVLSCAVRWIAWGPCDKCV